MKDFGQDVAREVCFKLTNNILFLTQVLKDNPDLTQSLVQKITNNTHKGRIPIVFL